MAADYWDGVALRWPRALLLSVAVLLLFQFFADWTIASILAVIGFLVVTFFPDVTGDEWQE